MSKRARDTRGVMMASVIKAHPEMTEQEIAEMIDAHLTATCGALQTALNEALDLFAYAFCHSDGSVIEAHGVTVGGSWVKQARAAIAKATGA